MRGWAGAGHAKEGGQLGEGRAPGRVPPAEDVADPIKQQPVGWPPGRELDVGALLLELKPPGFPARLKGKRGS